MRLNLSARRTRHVIRSLFAASVAAGALALGVPAAGHATTPSSKSSDVAVSALQQNQPAGVGSGRKIR